MAQLRNRTPYQAAMMPSWDEHGADVMLVAVKATFSLSPMPELATHQEPIAEEYAYAGALGQSTLLAVPDLTLPTGGTDVVLLGDARVPSAEPQTELVTKLTVGHRSKVVRVVGDRVWRSYALGLSTRPKPFVRMPLVYERAFGGSHAAPSGEMTAYDSNPLGAGARCGRSWRQMNCTPRANLEGPKGRLGQPVAATSPAGYGFILPHWPARSRYAGTYDAKWQAMRAPFYPEDFDRRFFRVGPTDLYSEQPLRGGEQVTLQHLSAYPWLALRLPTHQFFVMAQGLEQNDIVMALELITFTPDTSTFSMLWRALVPCDKKLLQVQTIDIVEHDVDAESLS